MAPELELHLLARGTSPSQVESLIDKHDIRYVILDRWSLQQPPWALDFFLSDTGYQPAFATEHLIVFTVKDKHRQARGVGLE